MNCAEQVSGKMEEHSCCSMDSPEQATTSALNASDPFSFVVAPHLIMQVQATTSALTASDPVIQNERVCCCSERLIYNKPEVKVISSNFEPVGLGRTESLAYLPFVDQTQVFVHKAEQQNDILKPGKIYLLNRAILD